MLPFEALKKLAAVRLWTYQWIFRGSATALLIVISSIRQAYLVSLIRRSQGGYGTLASSNNRWHSKDSLFQSCCFRSRQKDSTYVSSHDSNLVKHIFCHGKTWCSINGQACVGGALAAGALHIFSSHPDDASQPLLDMDIALLLLPCLLVGVSLGMYMLWDWSECICVCIARIYCKLPQK